MKNSSTRAPVLFMMALLLAPVLSFAQGKSGFNVDTAYSAIAELIKPEYAGRLTGSEGNRKAMEYVAERFRQMGLLPFQNTGGYLQPFTATVPELRSEPLLEVYFGEKLVKRYAYLTDFRETYGVFSRPGEVRGKAMSSDSLYASHDMGFPVFIYDNPDPEKVSRKVPEKVLVDNGVKALIFSTDDNAVTFKPVASPLVSSMADVGLVRLVTTKSVAKELSRYASDGCTIRLKTDFTIRTVSTANVAGFIPAADGSMDNPEIISCHLDHLGTKLNGVPFQGALDNASGVGVMLALAEAIAKNRDALYKPFVFVAFNAEEQGLEGSQYFMENLPLNPSRTEVLNFDMVGWKGAQELHLLSASLSEFENPAKPYVGPPQKSIMELAASRKMTIRLDRDSFDSDHVLFNAYSIPAFTFIDYPMGPYHVFEDQLGEIDKNRLRDIGQLALDYLAQTAYAKPAPRWTDIVFILVGIACIAVLVFLLVRRKKLKRLAEQDLTPLVLPEGPYRKAMHVLDTGIVQTAIVALVFIAVLAANSGILRRQADLSSLDKKNFSATLTDFKAKLSDGTVFPRPFPSEQEIAAADYVAGEFLKLGLSPYYQHTPEITVDDFFLSSSAQIPISKKVPSLRLIAKNGALIKEFTHGKDFSETTAGFGGGGSLEGPIRFTRSAFETENDDMSVWCIKKEDYRSEDEILFSRRGIQAILIEGDPTALGSAQYDYSEEKTDQILENKTYLRFIVSPEVIKALESAGSSAKIKAEWLVDFEWQHPKTVLACIKGRSSDYSDALVFSAPLDAPGDRSLPMLLALAKTLAGKGLKPQRPIIFIAFAGTYAGGFGSRTYLESYVERDARIKRGLLKTFGEEPFGTRNLRSSIMPDLDRLRLNDLHMINLVDGKDGTPSIYTSPGIPAFEEPAADMARKLTALAAKTGTPVALSLENNGYEHQSFAAKNRSPALTLALPIQSESTDGSRNTYENLASTLAAMTKPYAVSPSLPARRWLEICLTAVFFALAAAVITGIAAKIARAKISEKGKRAPDQYYDALLGPEK